MTKLTSTCQPRSRRAGGTYAIYFTGFSVTPWT